MRIRLDKRDQVIKMMLDWVGSNVAVVDEDGNIKPYLVEPLMHQVKQVIVFDPGEGEEIVRQAVEQWIRRKAHEERRGSRRVGKNN